MPRVIMETDESHRSNASNTSASCRFGSLGLHRSQARTMCLDPPRSRQLVSHYFCRTRHVGYRLVGLPSSFAGQPARPPAHPRRLTHPMALTPWLFLQHKAATASSDMLVPAPTYGQVSPCTFHCKSCRLLLAASSVDDGLSSMCMLGYRL